MTLCLISMCGLVLTKAEGGGVCGRVTQNPTYISKTCNYSKL